MGAYETNPEWNAMLRERIRQEKKQQEDDKAQYFNRKALSTAKTNNKGSRVIKSTRYL